MPKKGTKAVQAQTDYPISDDAKVLIGYALREREMAGNRFDEALKRCGKMSGLPDDVDPKRVTYNSDTGIFTITPSDAAAVRPAGAATRGHRDDIK